MENTILAAVLLVAAGAASAPNMVSHTTDHSFDDSVFGVVEADPMNAGFGCYDIFIAQLPDKPGQTIIGCRLFPEGAVQQVQSLPDGIVKAAIEQ